MESNISVCMRFLRGSIGLIEDHVRGFCLYLFGPSLELPSFKVHARILCVSGIGNLSM